jgi:hypothetical protein
VKQVALATDHANNLIKENAMDYTNNPATHPDGAESPVTSSPTVRRQPKPIRRNLSLDFNFEWPLAGETRQQYEARLQAMLDGQMEQQFAAFIECGEVSVMVNGVLEDIMERVAEEATAPWCPICEETGTDIQSCPARAAHG